MYNTLETEKKQKHKLLAIAGVMLAVIIVLIAGIIVIANGKTTKKTIGSDEQGSEFAITESESKKTDTSKKTSTTEESTSKKTSETTSTDESKTKSSSSTTTSKSGDDSSASAKTAETMPKTGPEDLVPIALVLGMLTTVVTAVAMHKRENLKK